MRTVLTYIISKFNQLETVFVLASAVGMFLLVNEIAWYVYPIIISFGGLMLLYWIMSMQSRKESENATDYFYKKIFWLSNCIGILGILLKLLFEEKAGLALITAAIAIGATLVFTVYRKLALKINENFIGNLLRGSIIGIIVLSMYLLS